MPTPPLSFPLHRTTPHHFRPLTDEEWHALAPLIARTDPRGRPAQRTRRTMDAIFWVACSAGPWRALPAEYGPANSAHRLLARLAHSGALDRLLIAASRHPMAFATLRSLEWRIVRAWRRAARILPVTSMALVRRLGMLSAMPAPSWCLPYPELEPLLLQAVRNLFSNRERTWPSQSRLDWLSRFHRLIAGRPSAFRTTEPPGLAAPGVR